MKATEIETVAAGKCSWFAVQDAMRINENNKSKFTAQERQRAITALDLLDNAYKYDEAYINYRQKFIVIKLDGARIKDKRWLNEVESIFEERKTRIEKVVSNQGVIYRFYK